MRLYSLVYLNAPLKQKNLVIKVQTEVYTFAEVCFRRYVNMVLFSPQKQSAVEKFKLIEANDDAVSIDVKGLNNDSSPKLTDENYAKA